MLGDGDRAFKAFLLRGLFQGHGATPDACGEMQWRETPDEVYHESDQQSGSETLRTKTSKSLSLPGKALLPAEMNRQIWNLFWRFFDDNAESILHMPRFGMSAASDET